MEIHQEFMGLMPYHRPYRDTSQGISQKHAQRAGLCESFTNTQEQTRSDGTTESNELQMPGFETG